MSAATLRAVDFEVIGTPAPQGSKSAVVGKDGRARLIEGRRKSGRDAYVQWRSDVAHAAQLVALATPLDGALQLDVTFRFRMPTSRPKRHRERGWMFKSTTPDLDKLLRAVGDAIKSGGLIADDARIAVVTASKVEAVSEWTGARIAVRELSQ